MLTNPDNWFPHFSVDGKIASGSGTVYVEGQPIGAPGWQARWIGPDSVIWNSGADTRLTTPAGTTQHHPTAFAVLAAGGGHWAGWNEGGLFLNGLQVDATGDQPWISREGDLVYKTDRQSDVHVIVYKHRQLTERGQYVNPRCEGGAVVWSEYVSQSVPATRGWRGSVVEDLRVIADAEFEPIPIPTPDGPFVLTPTHWGFFIRPWGAKEGWMYRGDCFTPDAICLGRVIYVTGWSGASGLLLQFPLDAVREPIRSPDTQPIPVPPPPVAPPPPPPHAPVEPPTASIPDHFEIVQAVDRAHPRLIQQNTKETVREFYWRAAWALHQRDANWGMLSRSADEDHQMIEGTRVSMDCVAYRGAKRVIDFLQSAGDGPDAGRLTWSPRERRESHLWVQPPPFREQKEDKDHEDSGTGETAELLELVASLRGAIDTLTRRCAGLEEQAVRYGNRAALRTDDGHVFSAREGGGGKVDASQVNVGPWETFIVDQP